MTFIKILKNIIEEYNPDKKRKILIVFDYIIADMLSNKNFNQVVTELFLRGKTLNISLVFFTHYYFSLSKNRLNSTHSFIIKIPNELELQIVFNHSSNVDFQDFMNLYKKRTGKPYPFLVIDTTLASDNPLHFRKNLLGRISKLIMTVID